MAKPKKKKKRKQERVIGEEDMEEEYEEFELTATTKGWTPRRRE